MIKKSQTLFKNFLLVLLIFSIAPYAKAQISIGASSYTTLKAAFDDINAGVHTGAISITISGGTTETTSCVLNESGNGAASYSSIAISVSGGPYTITGALTSAHLIDFNGADNVTLDGSNNLTISNTGTGTSSVLRLRADATSNMIKNTTLLGATSGSFGVIYFGDGVATGNDNNMIQNCNISAAGTNLPINGIYSASFTVSIDNSNNTVTGCNIYDFFNASTQFSAIQLNSGNSAWSLTNNKIYQTATRTVTSGLTNSPIFITSGFGYTINNNTIGYNSASGTGTYTMAATVALRFVGINCALSAGATTEIQGNTISNISFTTSSGAATTNGVLCGISITGTGTANIGTTTGNTIGANSGTNSLVVTSTTTQALIVGVHSSSTGNIDIRNNIMGAWKTSGGSSAIAGAIYGVNITSKPNLVNIQGNTIGNATANNIQAGNTSPATTGASFIAGINIADSAKVVNILGNTINNLTGYGSSNATNSYVRGIQTTGFTTATSIFTISNNNIGKLSTNSISNRIATGEVAVCGILNSMGANSSISNNTIYDIAATNTSTAAIYAAGISIANATNLKVFANKIYNIRNAGTSTTSTTPASASGILVRNAANTLNIYNNMITLGIGQTTNTAFVGIMANNGSTPPTSTQNIYHNSVYIGGTASSGAQPSFGIARTDFSVNARTTPIDIKNNIIINERTGGTGKHYAIANNYGSASPSSIGWNSNSNLLSANSATIGHWGGEQNFSAWQTVSFSDPNSISGVPVTFVDKNTGDLHLNMGTTSTPLESRGATLSSYTTDYDGESRPGPAGSINGGGTFPDLGADEFDGNPYDIVPPTITVNPVAASCTAADRTITATLIDGSGIPTTGNQAPKIYFRKGSSGTWSSSNGTLSSGISSNGTWTFTTSHTALGGVTQGDVIQYFVAAEDNIGNLNSNPTGAIGTVSNITTAPSNPLSYQIGLTSMSGIYQVGATQAVPFNTLTNAINTFNNACALGGAVTFVLTDANYSTNETFPIVIRKRTDASATNTLTIKPASNTDIIGSANNSALIICMNSYTTIDGSNNSSNSQNLTITNTATTSPNVLSFLSKGSSNAISNVALKNTIITNGSQSSVAINVADTTGTNGYFNAVSIINNNIKKALIAIQCTATSANGTNVDISDNTMNSTNVDAIRNVGIYLQNVTNSKVNNNTIGNFEMAIQENDRGVWLDTGVTDITVSNNVISHLDCTAANGSYAPTGIYVSSGASSSGNIIKQNIINNISTAATGTASGIGMINGTNAKIEANKINTIKNTNASGWGAAGIHIASSTTMIFNNFVSDVIAQGFSGSIISDNGNGIVLNGGENNGVYHNTVVMNTNQLGTTGRPAALLVTSNVYVPSSVSIQNNIFVNTQTAGTERYAIVTAASSMVFATIDNNNYYSTGPNVGFIAGANNTDLAALQGSLGGNFSSVSENPMFVSTSDFHINTGTSLTKLESTGAVIAGINTDIDGDARPGPAGSTNGGGLAPDMGADEFDGKPASTLLKIKAYLSHVDTLTGLMDDYVKTLASFPSSDPYAVSGAFNGNYTHVNNPITATVSPLVLATVGNDAIVDWVFIELKQGVPGATSIVQTKSALIQKDGDIVATDGVSALAFDVPAGNYYISLRHRSHLGACTANTHALSSLVTSLNFTNGSVALYGSFPIFQLSATVATMNGGDANSDGSIDAFDTILWEQENGLFDDYTLNSDYNMDGSVDAFDSIIWEVNNGKFQDCP